MTRILAELGDGDPTAAPKLLPLVYEELRKLAHDRMKHEAPGLTLQPTALVHEAYLRLIGEGSPEASWANRRHFFAAAAEAMRRILIERARHYRRDKHGGGRRRVALPEDRIPWSDTAQADILELEDALKRLEATDPQRSEVVKLRYFAGLTIDQTAELLEISPATVKRHWNFARAWLCHEITADESAESGESDEPIGDAPSH